jgi:hypothetical protein
MGFKRDFFRGNFVFDSTSKGIWKGGASIYNLSDMNAHLNQPNKVDEAWFFVRRISCLLFQQKFPL